MDCLILNPRGFPNLDIVIQIQTFDQLGVKRFKIQNLFRLLFTDNLQLNLQLLKATTASVSEKNQINYIWERIIYISLVNWTND